MKRALFAFLQVAATLAVIMALACLFMVLSVIKSKSNADRDASKIQTGMTVQQFVENFPADFNFGSISETNQIQTPCVPPTANAAISAGATTENLRTDDVNAHSVTQKKEPVPDRIKFPAMDPDDQVARQLADEASQSPHSLDRYLALDRHLSSRNQYKTASDLWTFYLQDNPGEAGAYCERAGAYQYQHDFFAMYKDVKKSCALGDATCCQILKSAPPQNAEIWDKRASTEASRHMAAMGQTKKIGVPVGACTGSVRETGRSFKLSGYSREGDGFHIEGFHVNVLPENQSSQTLSKRQLMELLEKEYKGREWQVNLTYLSEGLQHIVLRVTIGSDGRVKQKDDVRAWD